MIQGLVGNLSVSDTVGLAPVETVTFMADGSLEPLDVLRIAGDGYSTKTHAASSKTPSRIFKTIRLARSLRREPARLRHLPEMRIFDSCGGGHLAQRWSPERRFDNPSVYCESWKRIFTHIWDRISPTLIVERRPAAVTA